MKKIIITEPTRTVWLQETKQIDFKLEEQMNIYTSEGKNIEIEN